MPRIARAGPPRVSMGAFTSPGDPRQSCRRRRRSPPFRRGFPRVIAFAAAIALAGGPVKGGVALGESDAKGAFPKTNPKPPQDVLATIYRHLGVDTERHYLNAAGRPIKALPFGTPLLDL